MQVMETDRIEQDAASSSTDRVTLPPITRHVMQRRTGILLAISVVAVAVLGSAVWVHYFARTILIDAWIYLGAGRVLLAGGDLYSAQITTPIPGFTLGFTYPPFAAELFALAGGFPVRVGAGIITALSACALFLICMLALASAFRLTSARLLAYPMPLLVAVVAWLAFTFEPIQQTFSFGQVNLILAGLVITDCLIDRPWWPRGVLIGIAAAIKLTPLAFILFFLAGRRYREAAVATASFVVCGGLAWLVAPAASSRFWLHEVVATNRIGALWYTGNQSLRGMISRLGLSPDQSTLVWAAVAVAVVVLAFFAARDRLSADDRLGAVVIIGAMALLISPVSWSHHWVWVVPALIWGAGKALHARRYLAALAVLFVGAVFVIGPQWLSPTGNDAELHWSVAQIVTGDAYVEIALAFVTVAGLLAFRAAWRTRTSPLRAAPALAG